jgi:thymidylate kinase
MHHRKPKTIVVEMAGVAGAGKTSLARKVIRELQQCGYRCPNLDTIDRWRMLFGSNNPATETPKLGKFRRACVLLFWSIRFSKVSFITLMEFVRWLALNGFEANRLGGYRGLLKFAFAMKATQGARLYDVVIWDEGIISLAQMAARSDGADSALSRLWRVWDSEHIVCVILDLPLNVAMTRLRNRYPSKLIRFSDKELLELFGPGNEVLHRLSNRLSEVQNKNVLVLDATAGLRSSLQIVMDFLIQRLPLSKSLAL